MLSRWQGGFAAGVVTLLVVDQVVRLRQLNDRSRAVASDEFRAYMNMLLVGAPVLIDEKISRNFLEQAQRLGGEMARELTAIGNAAGTAGGSGSGKVSPSRLDHAVRELRDASTPLLAALDPETRAAVRGDASA